MVVFTCNTCGDSLKKNQVEKHYTTVCRKCEVLSCVDCGKDFWGDEYQQHTKCISEEEKYSGKNYQPKPNANKGEVKQIQWTQQVQEAIDKSSSNPKLRNLLERMKAYPNIPRKKAKFENFVRNSLNNRDYILTAKVWDLLIENAAQNSQSTEKDSDNSKENENNNENSDKVTENNETVNGHNSEDGKVDGEKKLSKRERKEERRKKLHKKEKKDKFSVEDVSVETGVADEVNGEDGKKKSKKKKRKRQQDDSEEDEDENSTPKKRKQNESSDQIEQSDGDDTEPEKKKVKFNWEEVITNVLQSKGEISLKRLRKKVVSEYISQGCKVITEEKLWTKFNRKVNKNPTFVVLKDRVKLKQR